MYILLWLAYTNTCILLYTFSRKMQQEETKNPAALSGHGISFFAISVLVKKLLGVVSLISVLIFYNVLSLGPLSDESVKILGLHLVKE